MWLIDVDHLRLTQKSEKDLDSQQGVAKPRFRYGILSHRWEEDQQEPKFEDYALGAPAYTNKGTRKVQECCRIAREHNLALVWSDTCCIDKRSSAELQEAINSMYHFYERAEICFAYLKDVSIGDSEEGFIKSEYFTRGWTLQELLAPADLRFYDRDWKFLGDKTSLSALVSAATGIQEEVIRGERKLRECSVAQRMSWAARRVTTRIEDRAYSLLGIFDVNMPMLYGEGAKSFLRLQDEIIKSIDDHSIFVWNGLQKGWPGLLAPSPDSFVSSNDVQNARDRTGRRPYIVNSRGVHGTVPMIPYTLDTYLTILPCTRRDPAAGQDEHVGIFLRRLYEDDQYMRVAVCGEETMENATTWMARYSLRGHCIATPISIRQSPLLPGEMGDVYIERIQGFRLSVNLLRRDTNSDPLFSVNGLFNDQTRIISAPMGTREIFHIGSIDIGPQELEIEVIRFGFDPGYNPVLYLTEKGVQYSGKENEQGVFVQNFKSDSEDGQARLIPSGENFQMGKPALGGQWSKHQQSSNGIQIAHMSPDVAGFWALRADRLNGLNVFIVKFIEDSGKKRCQHIGRVRLSRVIDDGHLLWDLQIDKLAPRRRPHCGEEISKPNGQLSKTFLDDIQQITSRVDKLRFLGRDT